MKTAFIYSEGFASVIYGTNHPMKPARLKLTYELVKATGLLDQSQARLVEGRDATEKEMLSFHTPGYLRSLKEANTGMIPTDGLEHDLGYGDNPVFKGVYDWSVLCTGSSVRAAELVASGEVNTAFNISGGLHHAMPNRASGFCYINDPVVAINRLIEEGQRIVYVDIDAHHGDGVEYAYYESDRVLTISMHESGQWLFPGTGNVTDLGLGEGRGFSVNLPLMPGTGDELYLEAFDLFVPHFIDAFSPDILVTQLGVDSFSGDPITHLNLTTIGFEELIKRFLGMNLPWLALGGGGYNLSNVARAWTVAWAVMNSIEPPEIIPPELMDANRDIFETDLIRDKESVQPTLLKPDRKDILKKIEYLMREALPVVKNRR